MSIATETPIERNAAISTWFGVGGTADTLARPTTVHEVATLIKANRDIRILGDGANLLVDDDGIDGLVLSLERLNSIEHTDDHTLRVGAGVNLPRLILETARLGLGGLEGLGGIPATVGGAVAMNAGGAFGQIADAVRAVRIVDHAGAERTIQRSEINFGYRRSGLRHVVIVEAELALTPGDPAACRDRLKQVMAHKKRTQPLAEKSAGCAFKNPTVSNERVSAGALIDQAGCKSLRHNSAHVSDKHANFICIDPGGRARDAIELMDIVARRVLDAHAVTLEREVVLWRRGQ